ncbi:MAG: hypothetical protein V4544_02475 [Pseudomonadota bacterium]
MLKEIRKYSIYGILGYLLIPSLNAMDPDLMAQINKKRENKAVLHKKEPSTHEQENTKAEVDSASHKPVESKVNETEDATEKPLHHKGCCSIQ